MNILTFDFEEWFHILDNDSTRTADQWQNYEVRIYDNMARIFDILDRHKQKATFFCMGWMAEKYPDIVKEIARRGYEIGSHTRMHQLVYEQGKDIFEKDVDFSVRFLENLIGKKVKYFRAPGFSITEQTPWAFDVLTKNGIETDCSVFPAPRAHGGFPSYGKSVPSIVRYNGLSIKELPINYVTVWGKHLVFSGGGYFRLCPYLLLKYWTARSEYLMSYLHPRDFDAGQPMIKELPVIRKFKSYVGLKGAEHKLNKWLSDFSFVDIPTASDMIDWEHVPIVDI
ncbi:MAG: polysaccharide deacetylase family protein [Bacteroidales bacterium]|jgi:polysaccharide deacetylase family protein (PEP-CTERM system associated)|nr:polysaccharide deacetylase family protein [Bacteroidales bacterium]